MPFGGRDRWGFDALRIQRSILVAVLREAVRAFGVEIQFDASLRGIVSEDEDGSVKFLVRRREPNGNELQQEMRTDLLIGTDGVHSHTRSLILGGDDVRPIYQRLTMFVARARYSLLRFGTTFEDACSLGLLLGRNHGQEDLLEWQRVRMEKIEKVARLSVQLMNVRLPLAVQERLSKEELFDTSGSIEEQDARLDWLYAPEEE